MVLNDKKISDLAFGFNEEEKLLPFLKDYFKNDNIVKTSQNNFFDYECEGLKIELKSRRIKHNKYDSLIFGKNKWDKGIDYINNNEKVCNGKTRITISFYKTANGKNMVMAPYSWSISGLQNNQLYYNTSKDSIIFSEDQAQTNYNLKDINGGNVNTTSNALYNMVNYTDLTAAANTAELDVLSFRNMKGINYNTLKANKKYICVGESVSQKSSGSGKLLNIAK